MTVPSTTESIQVRRRRRRVRRWVIGIAISVSLAPVLLINVGVDVPQPLRFLPIPAIIGITGWFLREAFLDARTRGLSRARSLLAALKGVFVGCWSTGL
jgi:hypothetical protein